MLINIKTMEGENNSGMQENKRKCGVEDSRRGFFFFFLNAYLTKPLWTMIIASNKKITLDTGQCHSHKSVRCY